MEGLHEISPLRALTKRRQKECEHQIGWKTAGDRPSTSTEQSSCALTKTEVASRRLAWSVPGPMYVYYTFQFNILWNSWVCEWEGLWFLILLLVLFSLCVDIEMNLNCRKYMIYSALFYWELLLSWVLYDKESANVCFSRNYNVLLEKLRSIVLPHCHCRRQAPPLLVVWVFSDFWILIQW